VDRDGRAMRAPCRREDDMQRSELRDAAAAFRYRIARVLLAGMLAFFAEVAAADEPAAAPAAANTTETAFTPAEEAPIVVWNRTLITLRSPFGGLTPAQQIPIGPSYQVPLARAVKSSIDLPVIAVGLITDFDQAEAIVGTGDADVIALARAILYDPRWPWHAAAHLGASVKAPNQYLRSQPSRYRNLFSAT